MAPPVCAVPRPAKELKAFVKVMLEPGETKTVAVMLDKRAFAYWSETTHDWRAESGEYMVMAGPSSEGVFVGAPIEITETNLSRPLFTDAMEMSMDMPLAKIADMSSGAFPREAVHHLLASLNE